MMITIKSKKHGSQTLIVDEEDWVGLGLDGYTWTVAPVGKTFYARNSKIGYLHRVILATPDGYECDHIDCNGLNNSKANLRLATHEQNCLNRRKPSNNTTGYKGVSRHGNKFQASIRVRGLLLYLGCHERPEDAWDAYCQASAQYHGAYGRFE